MPYRRLPNTDLARLRSMQSALDKGKNLSSQELPYPNSLKIEVSLAVEKFQNALQNYQAALDRQVLCSKKYVSDLKMAKLYISHFIQVLDMSVQRGEIKKSLKSLYGLDADDFAVPDMMAEESVVLWGERIIKGEQQRISQGGSPIYNPSIAKVKAYFDIFLESKLNQKQLQANTRRAAANIEELRKIIDPLVLQLWNSIEEHFKDLPTDERRRICSAFGVCYYLRKGEKDLQCEK